MRGFPPHLYAGSLAAAAAASSLHIAPQPPPPAPVTAYVTSAAVNHKDVLQQRRQASALTGKFGRNRQSNLYVNAI